MVPFLFLIWKNIIFRFQSLYSNSVTVSWLWNESNSDFRTGVDLFPFLWCYYIQISEIELCFPFILDLWNYYKFILYIIISEFVLSFPSLVLSYEIITFRKFRICTRFSITSTWLCNFCVLILEFVFGFQLSMYSVFNSDFRTLTPFPLQVLSKEIVIFKFKKFVSIQVLGYDIIIFIIRNL